MALFHLSAKIISRAKGESACAAAAYRSGERIESEYDGHVYDYRRKQYVTFSTVLLPDSAPEEYADRQKLWNAVELSEKSNAQLAREMEFALPKELDEETRIRIALEFIQENFIDEGMIADVAFHNPPKRDSHGRPLDAEGKLTSDPEKYIYYNPHAHVMLTLRPIKDGKWESKKQKLYVCEKDGQREAFTPEELKASPGWEKLYSYADNKGRKSWHTRSYVAEHPELTLVNKYPKSESRINLKVEEWNSPDTLVKWRAAWADKANVALKESGYTERIDHRSYKDQGLDLIPTVHEGKEVTIEEKRLREEYEKKIANGEDAVQEHTEIRNLNMAIREHNEEVRIIIELQRLRTALDEIIEKAGARLSYAAQSVAEKLERLRASMIVTKVWERRATTTKEEAEEKIRLTEEYINEISPLNDISDRRAELEAELARSRGRKKREIKEQIEALNYEAALRDENERYATQAREEVSRLKETVARAVEKIRNLKERFTRLKKTYDGLNTAENQIEYKRLELRPMIETEYSKIFGPEYNAEARRIDSSICEATNIHRRYQ